MVSDADFLGLGVQADPYEWFDLPDAAWRTVLDRLDRLRPAVLRVMLRAWWYAKGYDAAGRPVYDWDDPRMRRLYRLLDWTAAAGVPVILGEWDDPSGENDRPAGDPLRRYRIGVDDPRWAELVGEFLHQIHDVRGYRTVRWYTLVNEPNGAWSNNPDFDTWARGIGYLHAELAARGHTSWLRILGPDTSGADEWLDRTLARIPDLVGAYDLHHYPTRAQLAAGELERRLAASRRTLTAAGLAEIPLLCTELGLLDGKTGDSQPHRYGFEYGLAMADAAVQALRAGTSAVVAWDLDDAMHVGGGYGSRDLKGWGCWNSLAGRYGYPADDAQPRPWFTAWSLLAHAFPAGCRITAPDTGIPGVRAVAATRPAGEARHQVSVAVVNTTETAHRVRLAAPGRGAPLSRFRYARGDPASHRDGDLAPVGTVPVAGNELDVPVPGAALVVLTSIPSHPGGLP